MDEEKKPVVVVVPAAKKDGLLRFAFEGTPWQAVIKWLADESVTLAQLLGDSFDVVGRGLTDL